MSAPRDWIEPQSINDFQIGPKDIYQWRNEGYCLLDGLLPIKILNQAKNDALSVFPHPDSPEAKKMTDFGGGLLTFPSTFDSINEIALHPNIQKTVSQLLNLPSNEIRLTQAEIWPKYGYSCHLTDSNSDQRMHCDYPNHTLTHPPPWKHPEAVEMIIYLSDVEECDGATAVVPRFGENDPAYQYPIYQMPGFGLLEWKNNKNCAEEYLKIKDSKIAEFRQTHLYPREKYAKYRFGSVLLYRHDTWHRGTELKEGSLRVVMNCTYRNAQSEWVCTLHTGWSWAMYRANLQMERLLAESSVEQRCLLGFPAPGHAYWNKDTLLAVALRYGPLGMNMEPYIKSYEEKNDKL